MSEKTELLLTDSLPLTCSRSGTCCHGKNVNLNPWELACLAEEKKLSPKEFRDLYSDFGGIRLKFDGSPGWNSESACSQYSTDSGCRVHKGRPLVCRLYPLGRQKQNDFHQYIYQGKEFPCLNGCPEVLELPYMNVGNYLAGQKVGIFEQAHDEYLEIMQNLADGAFVLLLESGLAESGDRKTLRLWRKMGNQPPENLAMTLGSIWIDRLMIPEITFTRNDPKSFSEKHYDLLMAKAEETFTELETLAAYSEASGLLMGIALHLGRSLGANPSELVEHWILTAKKHGAQD